MSVASSSWDEVIHRKLRVLDEGLLLLGLKAALPQASQEQLKHIRPVVVELEKQIELKKQKN